MRIIPKLEIKGNNLVKGANLEGLRALGDPFWFSERYYEEEADEIIYNDVVASLYKRNNLSELIKKTSKNIFIPFIVGGGVSSIKEIEKILKSGGDRIFLNTYAIKNPKLIDDAVKYFGSSTIMVSIEYNKINENYYCFTNSGREETKKNVFEWVKEVQDRGASEFIMTSIYNDGIGKGFDLKFYDKLNKFVSLPFIVNGGFGKLMHLKQLLNVTDPSGIAIASCLHYRKRFLNKNISERNEGNYEFYQSSKVYKDFENLNINKIKNYLKKIKK